ncbi:hypothetical protein ACJX0J_026066, partial [Zea mays]
ISFIQTQNRITIRYLPWHQWASNSEDIWPCEIENQHIGQLIGADPLNAGLLGMQYTDRQPWQTEEMCVFLRNNLKMRHFQVQEHIKPFHQFASEVQTEEMPYRVGQGIIRISGLKILWWWLMQNSLCTSI